MAKQILIQHDFSVMPTAAFRSALGSTQILQAIISNEKLNVVVRFLALSLRIREDTGSNLGLKKGNPD
jgi:hypothetical protein